MQNRQRRIFLVKTNTHTQIDDRYSRVPLLVPLVNGTFSAALNKAAMLALSTALLTACGGGGKYGNGHIDLGAPVAGQGLIEDTTLTQARLDNNKVIITEKNKPIKINVTESDAAAAGAQPTLSLQDYSPTTLTLEKAPAQGQVTINADNTITYVPASDWDGTETFYYKVNDGQVAAITVQVLCNDCADGSSTGQGGSSTGQAGSSTGQGGSSTEETRLLFSWDHGDKSVVSYLISYGDTPWQTTNEARTRTFREVAVADLPNPDKPQIQIASYSELGLSQGDKVCFTVRAIDDKGLTSAFPGAACTTL